MELLRLKLELLVLMVNCQGCSNGILLIFPYAPAVSDTRRKAGHCRSRYVSCNAAVGSKPKRPEYKFQKKPARTKGNRGKAEDGNTAYDGQAFTTGRRGGLVRVPVTKA